MNSPDKPSTPIRKPEAGILTRDQIQAQIKMLEKDSEKLRNEFFDLKEGEDPQSSQWNPRQKEAWATIELYDEKLRELRKIEKDLKK